MIAGPESERERGAQERRLKNESLISSSQQVITIGYRLNLQIDGRNNDGQRAILRSFCMRSLATERQTEN